MRRRFIRGASINLQRILQYPNLPGRAGQTLVMFTVRLIFSTFVLVPGQSTAMLSRIFPAISSCLCLLLAGCTLLAQAGGGLDWLVPAALIAIIAGVGNAWVLLIEIVR